MKAYLLLVVFLLLNTWHVSAQLPNGSFAPDFVATDLNGNEHNLYAELALGHTVVLEMVAAWSTPAWAYHTGINNGTLGQSSLNVLWEFQGTDSGGDVLVLMIEVDPLTTIDDIYGIGAGSQGDWTADATYPIIDDSELGILYQVAGYPTIYTICPTGIITLTGQLTAEGYDAFISADTCQDLIANDVAITAYTGTSNACSPDDLSIAVSNLGSSMVGSLHITATGVDPEVNYDWIGELPPFGAAEIALGSATVVAGEVVVISITDVDENLANNSISPPLNTELATTHIHFQLLTDIYPGDMMLHIYDDTGTEILTGGPWAEYGPALDPMLIDEEYYLPSLGCYVLTLEDLYGDGIYEGAYCLAWGVNQNGDPMGLILDVPPSSFQFVSGHASVNEVVGVQEKRNPEMVRAFPNPACDAITLLLNSNVCHDVQVDVYDVAGMIVLKSKLPDTVDGANRFVLDVSGLAAGLYQVVLHLDDEMPTINFAKQ